MNGEAPKKVRKFKPNIIDALLVIAVIAAVFGIAVRQRWISIDMFVDKEAAATAPIENVRISFVIDDISKSSYEGFDIGDVFLAASLYYQEFGTLEEITMTRAEDYDENSKGEIVKNYAPLLDEADDESYGRIDVKGTVISSGSYDEHGFFELGGIYCIMPGTQIRIVDRDLDVNITVTNIERIPAEQQ